MEYFLLSVTGNVREHNEDASYANEEQGLWLVADGMGGVEGGEIASDLAITSVTSLIAFGYSLTEAIQEANIRIQQATQDGIGHTGMGSTIVALRLDGHSYEIAWVGDSRAYLWDGLALSLLTKDHSHVQRLVDSGVIKEAEARYHPQRNLITQALGGGKNEPVNVDVRSGTFQKGEKIILCSDGLNNEINDSEIANIMKGSATAKEATNALVNAALEAGGSDNITVIVIHAPTDESNSSSV